MNNRRYKISKLYFGDQTDPNYTGGDGGFGASPPSGGGSSFGGTLGSIASTASGLNTFGFTNLAGLGIGLGESIYGISKLNQLEKEPMPSYSVSPELQTAYSKALSMSNQGLTNVEKMGARNDIARGAATSFAQTSKAAGGNLSNVISGGINANELTAYDKLAATDAQVHRANLQDLYQLSGEVQNQKNLIDKQKIARREELEQAWANLGSQGVSNLGKSLSFGAAGGSLFNNQAGISALGNG